MSKARGKRTFAEIVRDFAQEPVVAVEDRSGVVDPTGRRWSRDQDDISAARALDLARGGAGVAWDPCGCGGYCGFHWYTTQDVGRMVASGTPKVRNTKRRRGSLSLWTSDVGDLLVMAQDSVQWGDVIDG